MLISGTDEAGRGPILGPMVMVTLAVEEEDLQRFEWLGVKDSKMLSSSTREEMFDRIREIVKDFRVEVIEPDAIDLSLRETESNLNWLEADTTARMISEIAPKKAYIDCPSTNIPAYHQYMFNKIDPDVRTRVDLYIEHKADVKYIVVSAASVVAKVIRDRAVEAIKKKIKIDFGSGYLSDPKTQDFLKNYHDKYPELFRRMWRPYKDIVDSKKQRSLGEF
ncbi:MAG: ribonuclease HII [Candidatus Woesearchaeota archaeon]|jgi:ribonuclease HII